MDKTMIPVKVLDFRTGRNMWGNMIHPSTFCQVPLPKRKWWEFEGKKSDKVNKVRRYSFCCHTQSYVNVGSGVTWTSPRGDMSGTVVDIHYFNDPRDMYTLTVEVKG